MFDVHVSITGEDDEFGVRWTKSFATYSEAYDYAEDMFGEGYYVSDPEEIAMSGMV